MHSSYFELKDAEFKAFQCYFTLYRKKPKVYYIEKLLFYGDITINTKHSISLKKDLRKINSRRFGYSESTIIVFRSTYLIYESVFFRTLEVIVILQKNIIKYYLTEILL